MNTKKDNTRNNTVNNTNLKPKIQIQTQSKTQTQRLPIDEKKEIQNNFLKKKIFEPENDELNHLCCARLFCRKKHSHPPDEM